MNSILAAATMGWSPQLVMTPASRRLAGAGEVRLLLAALRPQDEHTRRQIEKALAEVKELAGLIDRLVLLEPLLLDPGWGLHGWAAAIAERLVEEIARSRPSRLDIIVAGGPRPLAAAATLLGALLRGLAPGKASATVVLESDRSEHPIPRLPVQLPQGEVKLAITRILAERAGAMSYREIAEELRNATGTARDEATVRRLVGELQSAGLVECARRGRRVECRASETLVLLTAALRVAEALAAEEK